jgi:GNAT superfamily N-acetyltransferase
MDTTVRYRSDGDGIAGPRPGEVRVRRILPTDTPEIERFYGDLSAESRRTRFFAVGAGVSHRQSISFCTPDHDHREGFVAVVSDGPSDGPAHGSSNERIVGHLCLEPAGVHVAEVAIAVEDGSQGRGIGHQLMVAGIAWARGEGFTALTASTFASNAAIQRLLRGLGLPTHAHDAGSGLVDITIDLRTATVAT